MPITSVSTIASQLVTAGFWRALLSNTSRTHSDIVFPSLDEARCNSYSSSGVSLVLTVWVRRSLGLGLPPWNSEDAQLSDINVLLDPIADSSLATFRCKFGLLGALPIYGQQTIHSSLVFVRCRRFRQRVEPCAELKRFVVTGTGQC